jgi:hypothetical protein
MDADSLPTMSDAELVKALRDVSARIEHEDKARARGEGYWCGTPYSSDLGWKQLLDEELRRRGLVIRN